MRYQIVTPGRFHFFDLARELSKQGHFVRIYTTLPKSYAKKHFDLAACEIKSFWWHEIFWRLERFFKSRFGYGNRLQYFWHLLYSYNVLPYLKTDVDICIIASGFADPLFGRLQKHGVKVVVERGSPHIFEQDRLMSIVERRHKVVAERASEGVRRQELREYEKAWRIAVPSNFVVESFQRNKVDEKRLVNVRYGVDLAAFYVRQKPKRADKKLRLLYVGNVTAAKGVFDLIEVLKGFDQECVELRLVGSIANDFRRRYVSRLPSNISTIGAVPQRKLVEHYAWADLFLFPSYSEGFGMVLLQALACGLPVIATANTGFASLPKSDKFGVIVEAGNSDELAAAIKKFHDRDFLRRQTQAAISYSANSDVSWSYYARQLNSRYVEEMSQDD